MSDEREPPPRKRYRVTIEVDVHHGRHLADIVLGWTRGGADLYKLTEADPPPNLSSGGGYSFRYQEAEEWVAEDEYDEALSAWWQRDREARA